MKGIKLVAVLLFFSVTLFAQIRLDVPKYLRLDIPEKYKTVLMIGIDSFLVDIETGDFDDRILAKESSTLLKSTYKGFLTYYLKSDKKNKVKLSKQLTNFYHLEKGKYAIEVSYFQHRSDTVRLRYSLRFVAHLDDTQLVFALPLAYETGIWQQFKVGNTSYYFRGNLNKDRATAFDKKNTQIAKKFGLEPASLAFYMCRNYQEVLRLLGIEYTVYENGSVNLGYGVVDNTIFSVRNNEDFSHDIFHFYSAKRHQRKDRNWIAEEGIAYLWGNAYYADEAGEMITMDTLVSVLKQYLKKEYRKSIYELFKEGDSVYPQFDARVSIRSVISALIVKRIEQIYGQKGIEQLIKCGDGKRVENYLKAIDELLGITKENFEERLLTLIETY